ncbi:MAG: FAD-dependent oxidoreductase [Pseudomonadota bacterium]
MPHRVAVIGAGIAGLACARTLRRAGAFVDLFEKDKGVGGRIGTARLGLAPFDHGAQYITARSPEFRTYLEELSASGYARTWEPKIAVGGEEGGNQLLRWNVGMPGMSALVRPLAESVQVHMNREVHTIARCNGGWNIWFTDETHVGPYAAVAIAVPAPQARLLLGPLQHLADPLSRVRMSPCWALMVRLDEPVLPKFDVYSDMSQVVRWVGRNNSKPGRNGRGEHVVVHASQNWSRETEDADPDLVAEELWSEVCHILNLPPNRPSQMLAHIWTHGLVDQSFGETYIFDGDAKVGMAGDWCAGRLAEHGFMSGIRLGRAISESLS